MGVPGLSIAPNVGLINGVLCATGTQGYGGWQAPDIVGNLRVDQAWGSAQIGGAAHLVNAANTIALTRPVTRARFPGRISGNPGDKWGWAAMAGLRLNTPWLLNWFGSGAGDFFAVQGIYTEGAPRYIMQNPSNNNWWIQSGFNTAYGVVADGVYGGANFNGTGGALNNATSINLTTAWGLNASYEHFWTPRWRTSLYGGYTSVSYNSQANNILCSLQGAGTGVGSLALAQPGCDNNWTSWWVGSRTQWNVTKDFYMGLDVAYLKVDGMSTTSGLIWYRNHPERCYQCYDLSKERRRPGHLDGSLPCPSRLLSLIG